MTDIREMTQANIGISRFLGRIGSIGPASGLLLAYGNLGFRKTGKRHPLRHTTGRIIANG
jgi:hypothetical protein